MERNSQRGLVDYLSILFPPPAYLLAAARALLEVPLALLATVALPPAATQLNVCPILVSMIPVSLKSGQDVAEDASNDRRDVDGEDGCCCG
jgi:hypothetical protein